MVGREFDLLPNLNPPKALTFLGVQLCEHIINMFLQMVLWWERVGI